MEEAELLCQRVAIMDQAKIVSLDTPTSLIRALPVPYEIKFMTSGDPGQDKLESLPSVTSVHGEALLLAAGKLSYCGSQAK